jgi:hypothetical protein
MNELIGTVEIPCSICGTRHLADFKRPPQKEEGELDRLLYGNRTHEWSGEVRFMNWRLDPKHLV